MSAATATATVDATASPASATAAADATASAANKTWIFKRKVAVVRRKH